MSISTGGGDRGETGLGDGSRVDKTDPRIETYGTIDELNAVIGVVRATAPAAPFDGALAHIASDLFDLGSDLAVPKSGLAGGPAARLGEEGVARLDGCIAGAEEALPPLRSFILPGGTLAAAMLHLARTVCRRAERRLVAHHRRTGEGETGIIYLNRLSDLLFLYARSANQEAGIPDVPWSGKKS